SAASHVAQALAVGGETFRIDAEHAADADIDVALRSAGTGQSVVLVDRIDVGSPQRVALDRIRDAIPGVVTVNVGLPVADAGTVITASAASLLAARAARRTLLVSR
ncbi:MAG TPA: glycoside hydrolase family 3 protein, partial [Microbacterium sp.]|nr:glycoside hydrolase family 3 protein [Microbacterium sp.]